MRMKTNNKHRDMRQLRPPSPSLLSADSYPLRAAGTTMRGIGKTLLCPLIIFIVARDGLRRMRSMRSATKFLSSPARAIEVLCTRAQHAQATIGDRLRKGRAIIGSGGNGFVCRTVYA